MRKMTDTGMGRMPKMAPPKMSAPAPAKPRQGGGMRVAATNMGPRGFTDVQKAQINKRLKAKVIKST